MNIVLVATRPSTRSRWHAAYQNSTWTLCGLVDLEPGDMLWRAAPDRCRTCVKLAKR